MQKLSVVIITFNEEQNIARCIHSVSGIADEVVVVDSFSTDSTQEICKTLGSRFIQHKWPGYIAQKNFALTQTSFDFVLSLDADEALSDELKNSILKAKTDSNTDGYTMNRLTNYCGQWIRHGGWYPDRKLRLFDKRKGMWKGIDPHDCYEMDKNAITRHLHGDLLHYSYNSISDHIRQIDHFSAIAGETLHSIGKKFHWWQLIIKPLARFVKAYIIRGGFRDGFYGYVISVNSAWAVFIRYVRLREAEKKQKHQA